VAERMRPFGLDAAEQAGILLPAIVENPLERWSNVERVNEFPGGADQGHGQGVMDFVVQQSAAVSWFESMGVMPEGIGSAELLIDKAPWRFITGNQCPPARRQPQNPQGVVDDATLLHDHRLRREQAEAETRWRDQREVLRLGEKREQALQRSRHPLFPLQVVEVHHRPRVPVAIVQAPVVQRRR